MDFGTWVRGVFDRPEGDRDWRWPDYWLEELSPEAEAEYLARLFTDPLPAVGRYSDPQLDRGFAYLNSGEPPSPVSRLFNGDAPWSVRHTAIRAIGGLYEKLFAVRCTPHLCWINDLGASPLNGACYIWWDMNPACLAHIRPDLVHAADTDAEVLAVLRRTLALDSVACQEAALHGLGHSRQYYPAEVEAIIDEYRAARPGVRPELAEYAARARTGYVQ